MSDSNDKSRAEAELRDAVGSIKAVHENSSPRGADADDSDGADADASDSDEASPGSRPWVATMSDGTLAKGDRVSWNTSQGTTHGKVVEKKTKDFGFDGQHFTASSEEPAYIVASEKSGKKAAHKGSALSRLSGD